MALTHQLVACDSGFYLRVTWEGNTYLVAQLEQMASSHTLQLRRPPTIFTGAYIHNRGATVFIPGGNTLIMSRKVTLIGPNNDRDIEGALRRRFIWWNQWHNQGGRSSWSSLLWRMITPLWFSSKLSFPHMKALEQSMFHRSSTSTS